MEQGCTIILVRHGETDANRRGVFGESEDIPLTGEGRLQAHRLALRLAGEFSPTALISSSFVRARQTSEIIARTLNLEVEVIEGIHEREFGSLKGHPYARLAEAMSSSALRDADLLRLFRPEGGESLEDVRVRATAALDRLRVRYDGRQILVVCHGAVIRSICSHIAGGWEETDVIPNCALVVIEYAGAEWKRSVR